jgi:FtsH-binding integral membrane protein
MRKDRGRADLDETAERWGSALARAAIMVAVSFFALVFIPNTLLGYLTTRLRPNWRDAVVVGVWGLLFLVCCVVFLQLQRRRRD